MLATQNGHKDIVKCLIENGADLNTSDEVLMQILHHLLFDALCIILN